MRRFLAFLILGLLFSALGSPRQVQAQQLVDGIAAIVGDEIILHSEVNQYAISLALQMGVDIQKESDKFDELRRRTLKNLIAQKILLAKAREDSIEVEDKQVDQVLDSQIQNMIDQLGSESRVEEYFGMPIKRLKRQLRDEVKNQLLVEKLQQQKFSKLTVTRREVEEFFRTYRDSLPEVKEAVEIRHILLKITPSEEAKRKARERLADILKRIREGADFAEMARMYSEDPGSAPKGGDLGMIQRGDFIQEFEEVAFSLKPGEISNIVETQLGYHLIQLVERRGEKIRVRHILIRVEPTEEDENRTRERMEKIRERALKGKDFGELAKKYSDDETTADKGGYLGWFEIDEMQIPEFRRALLGVKPGEITQPFKTRYGYHIVKVENRRERHRLSLEEDWEQIEQMALADKRQREFEKWVEKLKANVHIEIKADYAGSH